MNSFSLLNGIGNLLGGIGNYSDWENPASAGMPYFNQARNELPGYYNDYIQRGQRMGSGLENQYNQLMNDPGARMNQIGASYHQSPGFQFQLQQALQAGNQAAAAGGMAGTPQHQQQNMALATNLSNQDYNQYLQNALGQYNIGLSGGHNLYNTGFNASDSLANGMSNLLQSQANYAYNAANNENQHNSDLWSSIGGLWDHFFK